ncbi:hypothetical protein [Pseudopontixanthobacter vadosimaris]|uniref:hypothetical protein n=1 Tax=Pseudopontixanthobacter vadosimaris TaxID=2726450 RepID=UPI00147362BF|nr:hypothetical protein [Pseudopontixanthobacter vadosimaris]
MAASETPVASAYLAAAPKTRGLVPLKRGVFTKISPKSSYFLGNPWGGGCVTLNLPQSRSKSTGRAPQPARMLRLDVKCGKNALFACAAKARRIIVAEKGP